VTEDFKQALSRVQTDYDFYIDCQTNPAVALAGYDLSPDEQSTLMDPEKLADMLTRGLSITISGTHDWVNRAAPEKNPSDRADRDAKVAAEVEAIKQASTVDERTGAVLRLMELVG
jgi:hypothetical protein